MYEAIELAHDGNRTAQSGLPSICLRAPAALMSRLSDTRSGLHTSISPNASLSVRPYCQPRISFQIQSRIRTST